MKRKRKKRSTVETQPFNLRTVKNMTGRVDCLAANLIERVAETYVPELQPLLSQHKEAIHMTLNEQLGPHVIDLRETVEMVAPFMPLIGFAVRQLIANVPVHAPVSETPKQQAQAGGQTA